MTVDCSETPVEHAEKIGEIMTKEHEDQRTRENKAPAEPSREVSQCGHREPGAIDSAGQEQNHKSVGGPDLAGPGPVQARKAIVPACKTPKLVERATALRGQAIARPPAAMKPRRKSLEEDLLRDSDIPYDELEMALRRVLCSFVERQDRASEALLLRINDLQYRMDDAEYELRELAENGSNAVKRKV
jgi:hypothetical protein